jgi:adenylate cyclase
MLEMTVVFADLTGSTGVFESLGNVKATQAITRLTHWIGQVCEAHDGRVVKNLGDGVLMVFPKNLSAVEAVTEMQRVHQTRIRHWPEQLKMRLQVGMARGAIVEQDGDCFGDAVNVASRLSDLSGPEQILVTDAVIRDLAIDTMVRFRCLGAMDIRGRTEACVVHRIEWQSDVMSAYLTQPAGLNSLPVVMPGTQSAAIALSWLDIRIVFPSDRLPIFLGRDKASQFIVQDPRVSRWHAKISWRAGKYYLEDVSSYGSWIRFADNPSIVALRRQECLLLQAGEVALGASFDDFTAPTVSFNFLEA